MARSTDRSGWLSEERSIDAEKYECPQCCVIADLGRDYYVSVKYRNALYWPNPDLFDLERFTPSQQKKHGTNSRIFRSKEVSGSELGKPLPKCREYW